MTPFPRFSAWRGPPLALQIMALLMGGLVVAQLVTLLLTLFLPPEPPARYGMADIATALRRAGAPRGLQREVRDAAPMIGGRGWLQSPTSRDELARRLGVEPSRVLLAFYTPLPFAGIAGAPGAPAALTPASAGRVAPAIAIGFRRVPAQGDDGFRPALLLIPAGHARPANLLRLIQAGPGPGGPGGPPLGLPGGGFPGSGFPGAGFPGGAPGGLPGGRGPGGGPPGGFPGGLPPSGAPRAIPAASQPSAAPATGTIGAPPAAAAPPPASAPATGPAPSAGFAGLASPPAASGPGAAPSIAVPSSIFPLRTPDLAAPVRSVASEPRVDEARRHAGETVAVPADSAAPADTRPELRRLASPIDPAGADQAAAAVASADRGASAASAPERVFGEAPPATRTGLQGAIDRARHLFGLAPAPFVEGDFVAALALPDGRWAVVQPRPVGLLSPWQKRVALWFLLAFGMVAPVGWLFARRLSRPLDRFADAAARLGRDPSVAIAALDGPAEIGRAAHAFNLMQQRLRAFVDDRTAMVGAISHDLRTPLTRLRFRIEDVDDELREGLLGEVEEMEAMISSVLSFIRDASTPGVRERLDLRTLLEDVVEDAAVVGATVPVEAATPATVEVDVLGMRRVLANLVGNALKYGQHARIRLTVSQGEAVAAVIDDGPGLPEEELEQVFQPFYRTAAARASSTPGIGLGLAVCRSIARAHGGDVRLCRSSEGFRAEVRVPLVFDAARSLAA